MPKRIGCMTSLAVWGRMQTVSDSRSSYTEGSVAEVGARPTDEKRANVSRTTRSDVRTAQLPYVFFRSSNLDTRGRLHSPSSSSLSSVVLTFCIVPHDFPWTDLLLTYLLNTRGGGGCTTELVVLVRVVNTVGFSITHPHIHHAAVDRATLTPTGLTNHRRYNQHHCILYSWSLSFFRQ